MYGRCGRTGKFIHTLNGHVGAVYQVAWSADSQYIASGSKDSTVKVCCFYFLVYFMNERLFV